MFDCPFCRWIPQYRGLIPNFVTLRCSRACLLVLDSALALKNAAGREQFKLTHLIVGSMMLARMLPRALTLFKTAFSVASARFFSIALFALSARHFSQHENGVFIYAITLPQLLIQLGTIGWLNVIRREIARRSEMPANLFKGFVLRSIQIPLLPVLAIGVGLVLFSFLKSDDQSLFLCAAAITVVYAVVAILREYLIALGTPAFSIVASETIPFGFASICIWFFPPAHATGAALLFLLGLLVSCGLQIPVAMRALKPYIKQGRPEYRTRSWIRAGGFSLLGFGGRTVLDRLDTIVLATLAPAVQFAHYNSAQRATVLLMVAPMVLLPVFSPHVSKAFLLNDIPLLRREMLLQTAIVATCVLPLASILILYPDAVMGFLFGEKYTTSNQILGLIVFSQVMFALSLPWSNLTLMSDKESTYGYAHILVLLLVFPIALGMVQAWGAYAIALASLVANTVLFSVFFGLGMYDLMVDEGDAYKGACL